MPLVSNRYGKGKVRVMRVDRGGDRHEVREIEINIMVEGDFAEAYTNADNSRLLSTDTMKNVVNVVARAQLGLDKELFCGAVAISKSNLSRSLRRKRNGTDCRLPAEPIHTASFSMRTESQAYS
jgi:urate oxidase